MGAGCVGQVLGGGGWWVLGVLNVEQVLLGGDRLWLVGAGVVGVVEWMIV